jgi:hypothetical protein
MKLLELQNLIKEEVERQTGKKVEVYHISPESDIHKFSGQYSPKFGKRGLFITPSYRSIANSWAAYTSGKNRFSHYKTTEERDKRDYKSYKNLTLYTLEIPEEILKKSEKEHWERYEEIKKAHPEKNLLGSWGWDAEVFIPEEYMPYLRIMKRETKGNREFKIRQHRTNQKTSNDVRYSYDADGKLEKKVTHYPANSVLKNINLILAGKDEGLKLLSLEQLEDVIDALEQFIEKIGEKLSEPEKEIKTFRRNSNIDQIVRRARLARITQEQRTIDQEQFVQAKKKLEVAKEVFRERR